MATRHRTIIWKQLLQQKTRPNLSLQGQVREMLVSAILDGQLATDVAIPSSREMAESLGMARNTVVLAYQQLCDEGYLVSRQRSGHFVNPSMARGKRSGPDPTAAASVRAEDGSKAEGALDWSRRMRFRSALQRSIVKPDDWQSHPYPFLYGQFDASMFPTADWRECCIKALGVIDIRAWAPDLIMRDDDTLLQQIRSRVLPRRGVWAAADELIITVGAQHALYMVADLLVGEQTRVAMEDPGYPDARNIFANRTPHLMPMAVDEGGLPVDRRLRHVDYVYVTPSHQCPTGVTMPLARREKLLAMADECDFIVIEDDFESENRFDGDPTPALKSLDRNQRVIYIGSLSKNIAPGLRIGYVVAPAPVIRELRALRRLMLRHPSGYIQRAFSLFLSLGHHDAQLRRIAVAQRERGAAVLEALAHHLPQCTVTPFEGGGACWLRLPEGVTAGELAERGAQRGVLVEPGDVFFQNEQPPASYIRLGFQSITVQQIEPGIRALAEVMAQIQAGARRPGLSVRR